MISQILMETLISDGIDSSEKIKAANSIAQLQSAQVRNEKLKIDARKASGDINSAFKMLKSKVYDEISSDHPEIAARIVEIADKVSSEIV